MCVCSWGNLNSVEADKQWRQCRNKWQYLCAARSPQSHAMLALRPGLGLGLGPGRGPSSAAGSAARGVAEDDVSECAVRVCVCAVCVCVACSTAAAAAATTARTSSLCPRTHTPYTSLSSGSFLTLLCRIPLFLPHFHFFPLHSILRPLRFLRHWGKKLKHCLLSGACLQDGVLDNYINLYCERCTCPMGLYFKVYMEHTWDNGSQLALLLWDL